MEDEGAEDGIRYSTVANILEHIIKHYLSNHSKSKGLGRWSY